MAILNSLFGDTRKTGVQNPFASMTSPVPTLRTLPAVAPHPLPAATPQGGGILGQLFGNRNPFPNVGQGGGWQNQEATGSFPDWFSQLFNRIQNWRGGS